MVRLAALGAIVAGPAFLVGVATEAPAVTAIASILYAIALIGLQVSQGRFCSLQQRIGFGSMLAGLALILGGAVLAAVSGNHASSLVHELAWLALPWGFHVVLPLGLLAYAAGSRHSGVLPGWMKAWLVVMGVAGALTVVMTALVWTSVVVPDRLLPVLAAVGLPFLLSWSVIGVGMLLIGGRWSVPRAVR